MTWQVLHYLAGLRHLGFDVWYVEDSDRYVLDTTTFERTLNCSPNVEYLSHYMKLIGLDNRWIFRVPHFSRYGLLDEERMDLGSFLIDLKDGILDHLSCLAV